MKMSRIKLFFQKKKAEKILKNLVLIEGNIFWI